ncbi:hypothetical protein MBAV_005152 [Candidatus Magnetobacterium bavaricum]|uniref:Uncharacterized protein n=1 Tax=Candidatus Magnetobacterium bavaricum TaxID=29290 RepID=A0A0F3GL07_9BACT|nr:hypothetical protein MBAV_005152 [Candidatus Magnetobacterium bavaricum]
MGLDTKRPPFLRGHPDSAATRPLLSSLCRSTTTSKRSALRSIRKALSSPTVFVMRPGSLSLLLVYGPEPVDHRMTVEEVVQPPGDDPVGFGLRITAAQGGQKRQGMDRELGLRWRLLCNV